jgi:hypothetical protein
MAGETMTNKIDVPAYVQALERYVSLFRRGESSIDGIRSELHGIRNDWFLSIHREAIDALLFHLTVVELALEACGNQVNELWKVQQAKREE